MKITFLMPCYPWAPMGGFRVVYEYANQLVQRGHQVHVVHVQRMESPKDRSLYQLARELRGRLYEAFKTPRINWQVIDPRVDLMFVRNSDQLNLPDADAIFATSWNTVSAVLGYDRSKGAKFYLIQHYETFLGPKQLVDQTWRADLNKVVVSKWLQTIGSELNAGPVEYIPNGVDHSRYKLTEPMPGRPKRVAMMFSLVEFKGARDGITALELAKAKYTDLEAILFGTGREASWIPKWAKYYRNPAQEFITEQIYNKSSIFLSSSWAEGFALPPAEAACCGCAVVATNSGGIADFIQDGITGLLSPPKEPEKLGGNLIRLLADDALRITLAEAARQRLLTFTWARSTDELERFLVTTVGAGERDRVVLNA